jgi:cation diffusion facilitator CzcD-associated flavoprotein CzcO
MVEAGLSSITMVQRNPTPVIPWSWFGQAHKHLYHEKAITVDADRREYSLPLSFYQNLANAMMKKLATEQPEQFDALERAGFRTEPVPNVLKIMLERQGGHYLDMGGSQMVIDGAIKMKSADITKYVPTGLEFTDGSTLEADVIVWCTGFENNMRTMVANIVGKEMVEKLDHHWYLDKEGEIRGAFKPIGRKFNEIIPWLCTGDSTDQSTDPRIWYTGGGVALARFYSRFLALQIKADLEGVPFEPYKETP